MSTAAPQLCDHGDGLAAHCWNQKQVLYEEAVRVPFVIRGLAARAAGRISDRLVSMNLDLLPTLADYAGGVLLPGLRGHSLRPLIENRVVDRWRDAVFTETEFCSSETIGVCGRMVRTERYKYVIYSSGERREQLFDLQNDRGETENLAHDAQYAAVLREHRARLKQWLDETGDEFPLT